MRRSMFLRMQHPRAEALCLRARLALACAAAARGSEREGLVAEVRRDVRRLSRERNTAWPALARLLEAGLAALSGDRESVARLCFEAERGLQAADMMLHANIAARRRGVLIGGDLGTKLVADADQWMVAHGVAEPARLSAVYAPGFSD